MATGTITKHEKILWENPNPNSSFAAQTVQLATNNCKTFRIVCKFRNNESYTSGLFEGDVGQKILMSFPAASNISSGSFTGVIIRYAEMSQNSAVFSSGQIAYTSGSQNDDYMIPLKIYGLD